MPQVEGYGRLYTSSRGGFPIPTEPVVHRGREPLDTSRHPFPGLQRVLDAEEDR